MAARRMCKAWRWISSNAGSGFDSSLQNLMTGSDLDSLITSLRTLAEGDNLPRACLWSQRHWQRESPGTNGGTDIGHQRVHGQGSLPVYQELDVEQRHQRVCLLQQTDRPDTGCRQTQM